MAQHRIPFDTGEEERLLGPLSISATIWLVLGIWISYQLLITFPPLPLPNILGYIPHLLPLAISVAMAFVRYKDMTLLQYLTLWYRFHRRRKKQRGLIFIKKNPTGQEEQ